MHVSGDAPNRTHRPTDTNHSVSMNGCYSVTRMITKISMLNAFAALKVVYYTVTPQLRPAPRAYETVWTVLQSLFNLHTHLLHAQRAAGCVCWLNLPGQPTVRDLSIVRYTTATKFDPSRIRTQSYPAPPNLWQTCNLVTTKLIRLPLLLWLTVVITIRWWKIAWKYNVSWHLQAQQKKLWSTPCPK